MHLIKIHVINALTKVKTKEIRFTSNLVDNEHATTLKLLLILIINNIK